MDTAGAQLLTLSLNDGFTFEAPVQVMPGLNKAGLLGQNVLDSLGITVCPITKRLLRNCTKPVSGIPVNASVMACDLAELAAADAQAEKHLKKAHLTDYIQGPVCDANEEPLNSPDKLFTFYPTHTVHIPAHTGKLITMQAYSPDGNIYRKKTEFVASCWRVHSSRNYYRRNNQRLHGEPLHRAASHTDPYVRGHCHYTG